MGRDDATTRTEIPPGTLYMLILKTLAPLGPMHGYGIAQFVQQSSEDVLQVEEGSLYPALQRMLIKGWVAAEWGQSENNRRGTILPSDGGGKEAVGRGDRGVPKGHGRDRAGDSAGLGGTDGMAQ